MLHSRKSWGFLAGLICMLAVGWVYMATLAPTVQGFDSAELTVGAYTLGLVHPTGYPLYMLLGHWAAQIPTGEAGFRLNLLSAILGTFTAGLFYFLLLAQTQNKTTSLAVTALYALAPHVWTQSIRAEVYTLHTLLVVSILLVWFLAHKKNKPALALLYFAMLGLASTNHATILFLGLAVIACTDWRDSRWRTFSFLGIILGAALALLLYLYFPWRAAQPLLINYIQEYFRRDPRRPGDLLWLISGQAFRCAVKTTWDLPGLLAQTWRLITFLWDGTLGLVLLLGIWGWKELHATAPRWNRMLTFCFLGNVFFFITYQVVDKEAMFLPVYLLVDLWIAQGILGFTRWLGARSTRLQPERINLFANLALLSILAIGAAIDWPALDLHQDRRIYTYATQVLQELPPNTVIVNHWATAAVFDYIRIIENVRPDVRSFNLDFYFLGLQNNCKPSAQPDPNAEWFGWIKAHIEQKIPLCFIEPLPLGPGRLPLGQAKCVLGVKQAMMGFLIRTLGRWDSRIAMHPAFPIAAGCAAFLLYLLLAWFVLVPEAVWSPDEGAKLLQLKALRFDHGQLNLDIVYTSQGLDPNFKYALINPPRDLLTVQGDALMFPRIPVFTLLVWPFYALFGLYGLYGLPALAGGITIGLAMALIRPNERRLSMWALAALGSPILIYSALFWEHTLAAAPGLAATWLVLKECEETEHAPRWGWWILVGCLFGLGTYLRLEVTLFALAMLAAAFMVYPGRRPGILLAGVVYLGLMLPYPFLHQALFQEQSLPLNARYLNLPLAYLGQARWLALQDLLIGPDTDEAIAPGWPGMAWTALAVVSIALSGLTIAWRKLRPWLWLSLLASLVPAAYFLFTPTPYRAAHGLLFTTPWALLGLCRIPDLWRQDNPRLRTISLAVLFGLGGYTLAMLVFRASSPHGGLEWGARFALLFYPLLAILAGWGWLTTKHARFVLGLFIILGIAFQIRGLATIRQDKQINNALNQALVAAPEVLVLSDLWWLPLNAAPIYPQKAFFLATSPETMAGWAEQAGDQGLQNFLLISLDPRLPGQVDQALNRYHAQVVGETTIENLHSYQILLTSR